VAPPDADVETLKALVDMRGGREALTELRQGITGIIQEASQHASLIAAGGDVQNSLRVMLDLNSRRVVYKPLGPDRVFS